MYSSGSSVLAARAKGSLCHHQQRHHHHHHHRRCYFSGGRVAERCCCCSLGGAAHPPCAAAVGFSVRSVLANPGFLYGCLLRQSALIRWAPSGVVVSRGSGSAAAAARYSRLTAAWDGDPCAGSGRRRWRKCGNRRISSTAAVFDEGFDDILGLLAEAEECFGEDNDAAADGPAKGSYTKEKGGLDSRGGLHRRFYDHKIDSSEEDRKSRSARRSACSSSSSSGDPSRNTDFRRRVWDESSGGYYRNDEIAEEEGRQLQKREEDSRSRRRYHASDSVADLNNDARKKEQWAGVKDGNTASGTGYVLQSRDRIQKDQRFTGREESKEELQKASHVRQSSVTDRSVVDKKVVNVTKEETSAAALLEVVRRQQDEMIRLRKDYQDLLRTTQVQNVAAAKASASCSVINTGVENSGENSTLPMGLLEEVQRQRNEIDKLNENYQLLKRAYKMPETCMINESNFAKSFGTTLENREKSSTSAVNLVEKRTLHLYNMDGQKTDDSRTTSSMLTRPNELEKQHQQLKRSDICESDVRRNTNYGKGVSTNLEDRKKKAASAVSSVEELQKHNTNIAQGLQNIGDTNLKATSHSLTEKVDIHKDSAEIASKSQRCYMTTTGDQQYGTNSAINLIEEKEEQVSSINEKVSGNTGSRKNFKKQTSIMETRNSGAPKTRSTQGLVKTIEKDQEDSSTSHLLVRLSRDKRVRIDEHVTEEINVTNDTQTDFNLTAEFKCEADKPPHAKSSDRGRKTVPTSNLVCEEDLMSEDGRQATQQLILRADPQQSSPENFNGGPVNLSDLQASSSKLAENEDDYSSSVFVQEAKERQKASLVDQTLGAFSGTSESWHTSGSRQMHELDYDTESDRSQLVNADVLESARRLAKSSSHYIGEFVDQLHQKISTSEETDTTSYNSPETQMEVSQPSSSEKPKAPTEHEDEVPKKEDTRHYSSRSEVAGPSDEIWDVRGAQEPSPTEQPEKDSGVKMPGTSGTSASASDGAIIKRSSKSLWSYIAEIVRMSWIAPNRSEKSMLKTGAKSSSDESVKSDAWYSGHEPEGDHEKNVKDGHMLTKQSELNKAAISKPHSWPSSTSGQVRSEVTRQGGKRMQENIEMPNPPGFTGGSYESDGSTPAPTLEYLAPSLENLVPFDSSKKLEHMHSTVGAASIHSVKATTSTPAAAVETTGESALLGTTSSSTYEEVTETDRLHVAQVGFIKSQEQETGGIFEVDGIEVKDVELKQRKLERKKQVLREEFEEWEEAYKLESELRKIDESFMGEALLEAKKAAEMWEVPVGAVLVQDGKIIARGFNLVEDLRDSTAHAEMICIREASNLLRTWRLAGTTLYVTLEPCPMCAGAILQARIDIVVWGAPNKLLGADGSWVRLFPGGGDEGKQGLDQADQAVGPVHPFHPKITIRRGVLATECADAMQQFFQRRRKKQKPEPSPPSYLPVSYPAKIMTKMHNIFSMMTCM